MSLACLLVILLAVITALADGAVPLAIALIRQRTGFAFPADGRSVMIAPDVGTQPSLLQQDRTLRFRGMPDFLLRATSVISGFLSGWR
jgi:hypothetical protein